MIQIYGNSLEVSAFNQVKQTPPQLFYHAVYITDCYTIVILLYYYTIILLYILYNSCIMRRKRDD